MMDVYGVLNLLVMFLSRAVWLFSWLIGYFDIGLVKRAG